jgi:hypothetical protein
MANPSKLSLILFAVILALFISSDGHSQSADDGFNLKLTNTGENVNTVAVQSDGKILIGGNLPPF